MAKKDFSLFDEISAEQQRLALRYTIMRRGLKTLKVVLFFSLVAAATFVGVMLAS